MIFQTFEYCPSFRLTSIFMGSSELFYYQLETVVYIICYRYNDCKLDYFGSIFDKLQVTQSLGSDNTVKHFIIKWKLQQSIISMDYFTTLLKHQSSLTLTELQSKIFTNKTRQCHNSTLNSTINQPQDLKIKSPFYKRIDQHLQNCKCMYHKRIRSEVKKIQKVKSQPLQIINNSQQYEHLPALAPLNNMVQGQMDMPEGYVTWKQKLSAETLKNYYYEYLKTLPSFSKFKRYQELDCYNPAFEQFLKNHYLVILDRRKTQKDIQDNLHKQSHKYLSKIKTQGNLESSCTNKFTTSLKDNQSQMSQTFINKYHSSRDGLKIKKIVFKSTGKQLELTDEEIPKNNIKQKKPAKKQCINRSSFFGVIQDQQVIRQICSRFIHPNKSENKEAKMMMKQLAETDIDLYSKLMNDMEQNLEDGVILPYLNESHSNILVKIVLQKMSKEVQSIRRKDSIFGQKNSIIQNLCSRFGWAKDQKRIGLQEFWKISQSAKNVGLSRKSFGYVKDKSYRLQRSKSPFMSSTSNLKNSRISRFSRMSGISNKIGKYFINTLNSQTDTNMSKDFLHQSLIAQEQKEQIKLKVKDEFKINSNKSTALKKGVLSTKRKMKKLSGLMDSEEIKLINGLGRKETSFLPAQQEQKQLVGSINDVKQDTNNDKNTTSSKDNDERNSSEYSNTRNKILRHIETNKKFLKRIQHQLKGNDCEQLVIGIGTNVLTKKRKIRAIYNALQAELKQRSPSKKHTNLLKYLEIYEQYCDLAVKMKKQKKIVKSQESQDKLSQANFQEKQSQAQQINSLIQDLRKQRQLKYFSLKWLSEQQDPKQELILIIPHEQKIRQIKLEKKKATITIQSSRTHKNEKNAQNDGIMLQKSLEDHVSVYFQMSKRSQKQIIIEKQVLIPSQLKMSDFQRKLLSYRKILKLQDKDTIYT